MRRPLLLIAPVAAIGVAGALLALRSHETDTEFLYRQAHPLTVETPQLEALVKKASDPVPGGGRAPATRVSCRPGSGGPLRNPWSCSVSYSSGHRVNYRIVVRRNGSYDGVDPTSQFFINGCCVAGAAP